MPDRAFYHWNWTVLLKPAPDSPMSDFLAERTAGWRSNASGLYVDSDWEAFLPQYVGSASLASPGLVALMTTGASSPLLRFWKEGFCSLSSAAVSTLGVTPDPACRLRVLGSCLTYHPLAVHPAMALLGSGRRRGWAHFLCFL